jgi:hypothetical protein
MVASIAKLTNFEICRLVETPCRGNVWLPQSGKSMLTIFCMHMVVQPAEAVVEVMRCYYGNYCRNKQPDVQRMPDLLCQQQQDTYAEKPQWKKPVVVFAKSMAERIGPYRESQQNHGIFKNGTLNDVKSKNREAAEQKRQHRAVYGAGYRSSNPQGIPVNLIIHEDGKYRLYLQLSCKNFV